MAVDAYVMPIWRFKVGDFDTVLEASGIGPVTTVTPAGIRVRPKKVSAWRKWRARRAVANIRQAVRRANAGMEIDWQDDGAIAYQRQVPSVHPLKAYLWWLDRRDMLGTFVLPHEGTHDAGRLWAVEPERPASFPHVANNSFYNDYFLPVDFKVPVQVEPYMIMSSWTANRYVSSTARALAEMEQINETLNCPSDWDWTVEEPMSAVKGSFQMVRLLLQESMRAKLPVIFWG